MPFTTINGYQHFYEDAGSGEPVVLLHGNENSSYYFKRIIPGLSDEFRVIAPHFRGMGFSEHVDTVPPGAWLEDVLALLDELSVSSAHVYGVSLGAAIGMRLALERPQRVRTLTLDAPFLEIDRARHATNNAEVADPPPWIIAELRAMHGDDWRTVVRNCERFLQTPELVAYLSLGAAAGAIAASTLIIRGDIEDPVHPLADAIKLRELIPNSRLWLAPDTMSLITRHSPSESLRMFCDFALDCTDSSTEGTLGANAEQIELLSHIDLFAGLRRSALARLVALARVVELRAGDTVFRQGEPAGEFSVISHGTFGVSRSTEDDSIGTLVGTLGPGQFFGEVALVTREQHITTVRCEQDGALLQIDGRHFRALLERDATASMAVAAELSRYLRAQDRARNTDVMSSAV